MRKWTAIAIVSILITAAGTAFLSGAISDSFNIRAAKVWNWVNPSGDCQFRLDARSGKLTLKVPGGEHDLWTESNLNSPRLLQPVTGNFSIETRLEISPKFDCQAAGLLIWQDDAHFIRLNRLLHNSTLQQVTVETASGDGWKEVDAANCSDTTVYLRLERRGSRFNAYYSINGEYWEVLRGFDMDMSDEVQIGIFAVDQWQNNPLNATFDYFRYSPMD